MPKDYADKALVSSFAAPGRELTFCPGCPHRASFFSLHNAVKLVGGDGFVCGDVGCYTMGILPAERFECEDRPSAWLGIGLATGSPSLGPGFDKPVGGRVRGLHLSRAACPQWWTRCITCGRPCWLVLDNSGTDMTGFQPHPGIDVDAAGRPARL